MNLINTLQSHFGLKEFRRGQQQIIQSVLDGKDVLAVLPTGGGKSLCYQLPAVLKNDLVIVISPLIALMKDQVAALTKRGIAAGALHSGQSVAEKRDVFQRLEKDGPFLLYLSPERTQKTPSKHGSPTASWHSLPLTKRTAFRSGATIFAKSIRNSKL